MLELNLIGLNCPIPVLRTKKFLANLDSGVQVSITTSDPASVQDLQDFCAKTGNQLIQQTVNNNQITTIIQRR
ncbi:MAG: sulfurtransferase TusA family protein [Neisseriaceae bacterium]|nr:MAG: sulfurtransferase TusA family protein [Neisseriaceae bacterium]